MSDMPRDPVMLLSYVNTQLRDHYESLEDLCRAYDVDQADLCAKLEGIGYVYKREENRFA